VENRINKNKRKYRIYMNVRLSDNENKALKKLMEILNNHNKSEVVRYLINNNDIVKEVNNVNSFWILKNLNMVIEDNFNTNYD